MSQAAADRTRLPDHLPYGGEIGSLGTILTFFPWVGAQRGQRARQIVQAVVSG